MQKKKTMLALTTKQIVLMALMTALSIVLGKFLALNFTDMIRVSFENLPIILSAVILGPVRGAIVALVSDLLGCFLRGYAINPVVTVGAVTLALIVGLLFKYLPIKSKFTRLTISILPAHFFASVVIKTIGLASFYLSQYNMGFWTLFLLRFSIYGLTATAEIIIIYALFKSKAISNLIAKLQKGE